MGNFEEFQEALSESSIQEISLTPDKAILGKLGELVNQKFEVEKRIKDLEAELKEQKNLANKYDSEDIPKLLEAAGLSEITTNTGYRIKVANKYRGNISEANAELALQWFIKSGGADTIKNNYVIPVSIADKQVAANLEALLSKVGLDYSHKLNVAWNTLAGVIEELDTKGELQNNKIFNELKRELDISEDITLDKVLGAYKTKTTKVQKLK